MPITTCIFDAYGTLFDVNAAARLVAAEPGRENMAAVWPQVARDWEPMDRLYATPHHTLTDLTTIPDLI